MDPQAQPKIKSRESVDYSLAATKANFAALTTNADQKANIIIAITSLIYTISLGQISSMEGGYLLGLLILMVFSLASLLLAIISVTPNYRQRRSKILELKKSELNFFFFGHFSNLSFEEFYKEMSRIYGDDDIMYRSLLKDIYQMGVVLHREKFKILFYSYRFFFIGLILSGLVVCYQVIMNVQG